MKIGLGVIFFIFLSISAIAQKTIKEKESHKIYGIAEVEKIFNRDNILTKKYIYTKDTLFTNGFKEVGKYILYHNNGAIKTTGGYVVKQETDFFGNSPRLLNGKSFSYDENNKLLNSLSYLNDRAEGAYTNYHKNGNVLEEGVYKKGRKTGEVKQFFNNSQLHKVTSYKNGKVFNIKEFYNKNAEELSFGTLNDGNGSLKSYDLETGAYVKTFFVENGVLKNASIEVKKIKEGEVKVITYKDQKDKPKEVVSYLNGKLHGVQKKFNLKGKLEKYTEYNKGVKNGLEQVYNDDGTLFYEYTYSNGEKIGAFKMTQEGTGDEIYVLNEGTYDEDGNLTDQFTSYLIDKKTLLSMGGKLDKNKASIITTGTYDKGEKVGVWKQYDSKGKLIKETNYSNKKPSPFKKKTYYKGSKILKSSIYYNNTTNKGTHEKYYPNGQLKSKSFLKNKKKNKGYITYLEEGKYLEYYKNGTLKVEGENKAGEKKGRWKWYNEEGLILKDYTYVNHCCFASEQTDYYYNEGKLSSVIIQKEQQQNLSDKSKYFFGLTISKKFNEDGTLRKLETKKKTKFESYGKREGLYQLYNYKGDLETEGYYKNDKKDCVWHYHKNGKLSSKTTYIDGKQFGAFEDNEYYKNGALKKKIIGEKLKDKTAKNITYFYDTKQIKDKGNYIHIYKNRKLSGRQGVWESYYKNGKLKAKGSYENGEKIGDWKYFYENGKLKIEKEYDKEGYLKNIIKYFDRNGSVLDVGTFKNGNGTLKHYDKNNKVIKIENYEDGESY